MPSKICVKCGQDKDLDLFDKHPSGKMGRHPRCKECRKPEHHKTYEDHKEKWVERDKRLREEDPEGFKKKNREAQDRYRANPDNTIRLRYLKARYGITVEQFQLMERLQGGRCAICGGPPTQGYDRLCVDHSHETGIVRGLLCFDCNVLLGKAQDLLWILQSAIFYLVRHESLPPDAITSSSL